MMDETKLTKIILNHWENHNPVRYAQLKKEGKLEAELAAVTERMGDLLYDLIVVRKMPYPAAMEIVVHQFLHPEPEEELP